MERTRDFLDLDPSHMLLHHWPEMQWRRPPPEFYRDPRLRTYTRALQVLCIELEKPGSVRWTQCEPILSYRRLTKKTGEDREALTEMYYILRGALGKRAQKVARLCNRLGDGSEVTAGHTVLEANLWNAEGDFKESLKYAEAKHVVSFLNSCAVELRRYCLRNRPSLSIATDPAQVPILINLYRRDHVSAPPTPLPEILEILDNLGLEHMEDPEVE